MKLAAQQEEHQHHDCRHEEAVEGGEDSMATEGKLSEGAKADN